MARDETLRLWGANIKGQRELHTPAGRLRRSGADPSMTQGDLAALVGVTQSTVARWEAGLIEPRRELKPRLAKALHLDVRSLFPLVRAA